MPAHPPTNDGTTVVIEPEPDFIPDDVPPLAPPPPPPVED